MRLGQTSVVHFGSRLLASVAGFGATFFIARELGGSTLGTYALFIATLTWFRTGVEAGLQETIKKRVSEVRFSGDVLGSAILVQLLLFGVAVAVSLAVRPFLNAYLGFDGTYLLLIALAGVLLFGTTRAVLHGEQRIHVASVLKTLDQTVRSAFQIAVVFLGILGGGLLGLTWGYVLGAVVAAATGLVLVSVPIALPTREGIASVLSFTRYSWLSKVEGRAFSAMDTVVLGLFVAPNLIGYYEVAWNLASLLAIFGTSVAQTLFPTVSQLESEDEYDAVGTLVNQGLAYSGLFLIPGLVGVMLIGDKLLAIYGGEFRRAGLILVILVAGRLIYAYEATLVHVLNALDTPEKAFRVNLVFVASNLVLNVWLVSTYGWIGAAVGTTLAATVGLGFAYASLSSLISFTLPGDELARQAVAASVMGVVVWLTETAIESIIPGVVIEAVLLAGLGATVFFLSLSAISQRFRTRVRDNIPDLSMV